MSSRNREKKRVKEEPSLGTEADNNNSTATNVAGNGGDGNGIKIFPDTEAMVYAVSTLNELHDLALSAAKKKRKAEKKKKNGKDKDIGSPGEGNGEDGDLLIERIFIKICHEMASVEGSKLMMVKGTIGNSSPFLCDKEVDGGPTTSLGLLPPPFNISCHSPVSYDENDEALTFIKLLRDKNVEAIDEVISYFASFIIRQLTYYTISTEQEVLALLTKPVFTSVAAASRFYEEAKRDKAIGKGAYNSVCSSVQEGEKGEKDGEGDWYEEEEGVEEEEEEEEEEQEEEVNEEVNEEEEEQRVAQRGEKNEKKKDSSKGRKRDINMKGRKRDINMKGRKNDEGKRKVGFSKNDKEENDEDDENLHVRMNREVASIITKVWLANGKELVQVTRDSITNRVCLGSRGLPFGVGVGIKRNSNNGYFLADCNSNPVVVPFVSNGNKGSSYTTASYIRPIPNNLLHATTFVKLSDGIKTNFTEENVECFTPLTVVTLPGKSVECNSDCKNSVNNNNCSTRDEEGESLNTHDRIGLDYDQLYSFFCEIDNIQQNVDKLLGV